MVGHWRRPRLKSAVNLLFICMAVYLSNYLVQSSTVDSTLFLTQPSSSFNEGVVLYTFQPRIVGQTSVYGIEYQESCSNGTFSLDQSTGELSIVRTIDYSQSSLEPMCVQNSSRKQDHFISLQTFYCFVTIDSRIGILVVINVIPELSSAELRFPQTFYSSHVVEGEVNATVTITGRHTSLQVISTPVRGLALPSYRIIGEHTGNFTVIQSQRKCVTVPVVVTAQPLYRSQQDYYELTLEAYTSSISTNVTIGVQLLDVNDQLPRFTGDPKSFTLQDDTPIGMEFGHLEAVDMDTGLNGEIRYALTNSSSYSIHPLTGSLFLLSPASSSTLLSVMAIDLGVPPQTIETNVTVSIEDSNVLPPVIIIHGLGPVSEGAPMGLVVGAIELINSNSNLEVSLTLKSNGPYESFRLSNIFTAENGSLIYDVLVNGALDFETTPNGLHRIVLNATDGTFSTVEHHDIEITDVNEAPSFPQPTYVVNVFEGLPVGSEVTCIAASDPDQGVFGLLSYNVSGNDPNKNLITIHSLTGIIYTTGGLNYTSVSSIRITVTAQDSEQEEAIAILTINILDRNDNMPVFTSAMNSTVTIPETNRVVPVFHFTVSDMDSGCAGAVEYSIIHAEPQAFRIDSFSGLLFPMNDTSLDYERFQVAKVVVRATDLGSSSSYSTESSLFIILTDVDDEAPVIDPIDCPCFIQEHSSTESCFPISVQDQDSTVLQFSIVSGNELNAFRINDAGVVSTTQMLNRAMHGSFVLSIIATDGTQESEPENLTIIIVDVNERPIYPASISITAPLDLSIGESVGNVAAMDPDVGYNGVILYQFQSNTNSTIMETFYLEPLSGDLITRSSLMGGTYIFTVVATDLSDSASSASTTVTVTTSGTKNNPPSFNLSADRRTVPADLPLNSFVAQLSAMDQDSGANGQLAYSIIGGNHSSLFSVNSSGALISSQSLSSRAGDLYILNISVTDHGLSPLSAYQEYIVEVYPATIRGTFTQLVHNPAIGVCHYQGTVLEMTELTYMIASLPQVGSQTTTYRILTSTFSYAFLIDILPSLEVELKVQRGFANTVFTNREAVFITLRAEYGDNFHLCSVTVIIEDINNNPAVFVSDTFAVQVYSGTPTGATVFQLQAVDADNASNSQMQFALATTGSPFSLDRDSGVLTLSSSLDQPSYTLNATVTDCMYEPLQTSTATVVVTVLQTSNIPPAFIPHFVPPVTVPETTRTGDVIAMLSVMDTDIGVQGENRFCIQSGNEHGLFRITRTGETLVHKQLDYETYPHFYRLVVRAYDSSNNPQYQDTSMNITITDENDEIPAFSTPVYTATVMENQAAGLSIITVNAVDRDDGLNGVVVYSLLGSNFAFSIDADSGGISTSSRLDREFMSQYTLSVVATDQAAVGNERLSSTAEVRVLILDENDNNPTFNVVGGGRVVVQEDIASGSEIVQFEATDLDEGANSLLKYSIVSGNDDFMFSLNPWNGSLSLKRSLDFESGARQFILAIQVSDCGQPSRSSEMLQLTVDVTDANDNYPTFSLNIYECSFMEMTLIFNSNCQVHATDVDGAPSSITYSIVNAFSSLPFQINSRTGVLSIDPSAITDAETISQYILTVQATDSGLPRSLSATALVVITVEDTNDNIPLFVDPVSTVTVGIPELIPNNTFLFFAHAFDRDIAVENSNNIMYQLTSANKFRVHPQSGAVFLEGSLDAEESIAHELEIRALETTTSASTQRSFNIQVVDINENLLPPTFSVGINPSIVAISRAAIRGDAVTTLTAVDPEGGTVSYHIIGGSGYGLFQIDTSSGHITVVLPLMAVEYDILSLIVMADDGGRFRLTSEFTFSIVLEPDANTKPFFVAPVFYASLPESTGSEQIFTHVRAEVSGYTDTSVSYSITGGNEGENFAINASTGAVYVSLGSRLNREIVPSYNLTVTALKPGQVDSSTTLLIIELTDANDFGPEFVTDFNVSVFENHPVDSSQPFVRVFAIDSDIGNNGRLSYSIHNLTAVPFEISETTGFIHLTSSLNAASVSEYTITVVARDHGIPTLEGMVTLTVHVIQPSPVDSPAPFFQPISQQMISEGTPPGTKIATISAQNSPTNTLLYRFRENTDQFAISPNSGEVYLIRSLDREVQSSFSHTISATDGVNMGTVVLSIVVTDINEHRPQFTQEEFQFSVMENVQSNLTFGRIIATDPESDVMYSVVDSLYPRSLSLFGVSSDGAVYTLSSEIDREEIPVHILTVAAQDFGDPPLLNFVRLVINVADENDNSPILENMEIFIPEDTPVSESIFRVSGFDPDKGENARVLYVLLSANQLFSVNMTSGDIILTSSLDAETLQQHILVISASNPDGLRSSTVRIIVNVIDVLDSVPRLLNPGTVAVQENLPMYTFVTSLANSSELNTSRPVFYSIVDGNTLGHFFVEPLTGIVRTTTQLDRETVQSYNLTVQGAFKSGFEGNVSFTVTVSDVNDQTPQFPSSYLSFSIPENFSLHVALVNLNVTDLDKRSNALYVIVDGFAAEMFSVDDSGNLMLSQNLDRENKFSSIAFEMYVIDTDYPNWFSSAMLYIEVIDSNDNPPQFQYSEYNFTISVPTQVNIPFSGVRVQATDADKGVYAEVQYEIAGGNGTSKFGINRQTGEILVTNNYQLQPQYMLTISAIDGGGLQSSIDVTIFIKGCGFQNLLFLPAVFMVEILENVTLDTSLIGPAEFNIEYFGQRSMVQFSLPIFNPLFDVDPLTGRVFTRGEIDREQDEVHYLVLHATDTANPQRLAQADVEVRVVDVNDNSPIFDQTLGYVTNILNTASPGDEVIRVRATDDDMGINSDVVYSLVTSAQSAFFRVDAESGGIFVDSSLNTAQLGSSISLTVVATDMGNPPRTTEIEVAINIVDSNAPRFTRNVYHMEVMEGIAVGSLILTVAVNVSSNNPSITFRLDTDDPFIPLSLGFFNGEVAVVDPGFDFELVPSYSLTVLAEDSTTSLTGQATLNIIIIDENDNAPVFDAPGSFYTESIDENVNAGTVILQVSANDIDSPVNSEITFRLDPNSPFLDTFSIDDSSGVITTLGSIDYEQYPVYELDILAEDSGVPQRTGSATVRIITNNLNDNPPLFTENTYQATISANAEVGTNIRFVAATDPDGLSPVVYSIISVGIGHENFAINSNGLITINQSLTQSSVFMYTLNISAFDGLHSYAAVVIEVVYSNDNPPVFNQSIYYSSVEEGSPRGVYVSQVFATDRDRGNNADITYSIANSSTLVLSFFNINPQSGIITTAGGSAIDRELTPSFQFIVVARDGGGRTGNARVVVTVMDVNDNAPRFLTTAYVGSVIESAPMGFPVLPLDVSDLDEGDNSILVFSVFPINVPRDQFPFTIDRNHRVAISISLSFDVASNYTFVVSVRDSGTQPLFANENATVVINVQEDVTRNPPQFIGVPYMFSIPDNIGQTDEIGVVAVDQDTTTNCLLFYRINPSLFDGNNFNIDTNLDSRTGTISRETSLTSRSYTIVVMVEANCINPMDFTRYFTSNMVTVMIEVYRLNSRPRFQFIVYSGNIAEDSDENTPIQLHSDSRAMGSLVDIEAVDTDEGVNGTVIYSIPDRESMMLPFDIGPMDGAIHLTGELDYETRTTYFFQVSASDGGTPPLSASALVFIYVTDVNDSPPEFEFSQYSIEIREDTFPNATFLTVTANDNDTSSVIRYFLSGTEFKINPYTGDISTLVSLDRETRASYTLMAVASDGRFSDEATVVVSIMDVNDNAPTFNETQITLSLVENHPTGETIVQLLATDADEGDNAVVTYVITEQPDNGEVTIDPSTGEVSFLLSPDFEISPRLEFQVTASDGGLQDFATVAINLLDINDNAPIFTRQNYSASVHEHSSEVANVIRVEANDADSGINGTVTYRIEGIGAANFRISTTGVITTRRSFDRETDPFFDILVIASDFSNMSSSAMVHVSITDINDQRPTFPQSTYLVSVLENEPAGFVILTTTATDGDVGNNARITYGLSGENSNEFMRVSHNNGSVSIVLANELNRERLSSYNLSLRAIDGGVPEMDSIVAVVITVLDVNDNCPEFREPRYSETIPENITVGTTILSVEAFDRDLSGQMQLVYSIRDSSLIPEILIDSHTGDISIASALDFETRPVYTLMIDVSDGDSECMVTPTIVNIMLGDINDNPPFFHEHEPTYTIEENNMPNVIVDTFGADDRDTVSLRGRITFSIESGNINNTFSIGATDGTLKVQMSLDREKISNYHLVIAATDNGSPSLTGTTNFTIIVGDINDNNPTGGHQDIYIYLLDGVAPIITLGYVFVNDSDLVNNHAFMVQNTNGPLEIDASDGSISIGTATPDMGTHEFQVTITDEGNEAGNVPAMTNITARVLSVSENTLAENSFIMQLNNISPQSFTDTVLAEFLSHVAAVISSALQSSINSAEMPVEVQVLSIQPSLLRPQNLDVTVAVKNLNDGSYIHPELVQHIIHINEGNLETRLGVSIHTELVDLCSDSTCSPSNQVCSNVYSYNSTNSKPFGTISVTYLGLTSNHTTACGEVMPSPCEGIVCQEPSYCVTVSDKEAVCYDDCDAEPCLNGGTCVPQKSGFYCSCPEGYNGRNCEQTGATFTEGTYAAFPSIKTRLEGSISIDFITEKGNGLLAFVGRYDDDFMDFVSIELINGHPSLRVSYGPDNHTLLTINSQLNDQQWHRVSVIYNYTVSAFYIYGHQNMSQI